jgi:ELWxxDGT repeat protein
VFSARNTSDTTTSQPSVWIWDTQQEEQHQQEPSPSYSYTNFPSLLSPRRFTFFNNKLYFLANNPQQGLELYVYDGVSEPAQVGEISPGAQGITFLSNPGVANDELLVMTVNTTQSGWNLCVVDKMGVMTLLPISVTSGYVDGFDYVKIQENLYFVGPGTASRVLWRANLTSMAIDKVKVGGAEIPVNYRLAAMSNSVVFDWSDYTPANTVVTLRSYDGVSLRNISVLANCSRCFNPHLLPLHSVTSSACDTSSLPATTNNTNKVIIFITKGSDGPVIIFEYDGNNDTLSQYNTSFYTNYVVYPSIFGNYAMMASNFVDIGLELGVFDLATFTFSRFDLAPGNSGSSNPTGKQKKLIVMSQCIFYMKPINLSRCCFHF